MKQIFSNVAMRLFSFNNRNKVFDNYSATQLEQLPKKVNNGVWRPDDNGQFIKCRKWRTLQGRYRCLLDGRLITGPGQPRWIFVLLYFIFTYAIYMAIIHHPAIPTTTQWIITGLVSYLFLDVCYSLLRIVLSDPGIIPPPETQKQIVNSEYYKQTASFFDPQTTVFDVIPIVHRGKKTTGIFCPYCRACAPLSAYHCQETDACIERFDHYCDIFGTAVGLRNYGYFFRFCLTGLAFLSIVTMVSLVDFVLAYTPDSLIKNVTTVKVALGLPFLILLPFLLALYFFRLVISHVFLVFKWQTLREYNEGVHYATEFDSCAAETWFKLKNFVRAFRSAPEPLLNNIRDYVVIRAVQNPSWRMDSNRPRVQKAQNQPTAPSFKGLSNTDCSTCVNMEEKLCSVHCHDWTTNSSKNNLLLGNSLESHSGRLKERTSILGITQTTIKVDKNDNVLSGDQDFNFLRKNLSDFNMRYDAEREIFLRSCIIEPPEIKTIAPIRRSRFSSFLYPHSEETLKEAHF